MIRCSECGEEFPQEDILHHVYVEHYDFKNRPNVKYRLKIREGVISVEKVEES